MGPLDAIGFDYEIAELIDKQVTHFERKSDGATAGAWASLGIPVIVAGAPAGWNTYKYMPTAAFDVPVTIYFRACNVQGCGPAVGAVRLRAREHAWAGADALEPDERPPLAGHVRQGRSIGRGPPHRGRRCCTRAR